MSADKRKVSTDALETLGTIIGPNEKRDAIHLAVIPAMASQDMMPGQAISYQNGNAWIDNGGIGIVDPFLLAPVKEGQMFWMVLRPRLITSLRHVWTHPALPDEGTDAITQDAFQAQREAERKVREKKVEESKAWVMKFAVDNYFDYDTLIAAAMGEYENARFESYGSEETYLHFSGEDAHGEIPSEFWDHVETITGKKPPSRATHFSCSC